MTNHPTENLNSQWESVHKCPKCGNFMKLDDIDLKAVTTGIVTCTNCDWTGRINIQIVGDG